MNGRPTCRAGVPVLIACLLLPAGAFAQQPPREGPRIERKGGTYLKTGLAFWQGNIFSRGRFIQWNVDLFDVEYHLTSVNAEIETYFSRPLPFLSGFSIAYRKDAIRRIDSGHMISGTLFRDVDFTLLALKVGGGIEWGMPSLNFDQTEFDFVADGTVRYRHTYPDRNATVPFVGTSTDGARYPFVEVSAVQRPWVFLVELGMRINLIGFHFDDYEVSPGDEVVHAFSRRRVMVPYLFANVGIRLF